MSKLAWSLVILLWCPAYILAEDTTPAPPITIKRIIQHQEGEAARTIEVPAERPNAVPDATAITSTEGLDLTGNWTIAEDSRAARVPIKDRQLRIKSGGDGSLIAEFVKGADCPTGSGRRTHYIKGNLSGNSLSGTIKLCPSAAFITKCGDESVYTTKFQAEVRDANTIVGRYTTTGYRIEAGGCVKDSSYDEDSAFLIERHDIGTQATALQADPLSECAPSPQIEERVVPGGGETPTDSEVSGDPVNLNAYCLAKHGEGSDALLLNKQDAYSWKCFGSPALHTIDVNEACRLQDPFTTAELGNRCDPYSWSCTKLPARKLVYVRLDRIKTSYVGEFGEGKPDVSIYFTARHASPRCSGTEYGDGNRTCGEWKYTFSEKIDHLDIEINGWVYPFYLYEGSVLQIDFWAIEKDPFEDDSCGVYKSGGVVITPVRETFAESDNWGIGESYLTNTYYESEKTISCGGDGSFSATNVVAFYTLLDIPQ